MAQEKFQNACSNLIPMLFHVIHIPYSLQEERTYISFPLFSFGSSSYRSVKCRPSSLSLSLSHSNTHTHTHTCMHVHTQPPICLFSTFSCLLSFLLSHLGQLLQTELFLYIFFTFALFNNWL